jgi:isopenicillin N synthase-like dioxygenase
MTAVSTQKPENGSSSINAANSVPVIDIAPFLSGADGKSNVVAQVQRACEEIGFFSIIGHGVSSNAIGSVRANCNQFFDFPLEEKLKVKRAAGAATPGYSFMGDISLARSLGRTTPPDLQEGFSMCNPGVPPEPYFQTEEARRFFLSNVWPERPTELRHVLESYFHTMEKLAASLMQIFALALDLPENYFQDKLDKSPNLLRTVRYPAQTSEPVEGQLRSGEHTDYGSLTVLLAEDKPGGLQVRLRNGKWIDVHPVADSFVINIGDLMMRWTNDHWISNLHRVANPPKEFSSVPRLSVVFFQRANYDAEVRCIDQYCGVASPEKYEPILAGSHWFKKNTATREAGTAS